MKTVQGIEEYRDGLACLLEDIAAKLSGEYTNWDGADDVLDLPLMGITPRELFHKHSEGKLVEVCDGEGPVLQMRLIWAKPLASSSIEGETDE